jgi:hypothetical protein
MTETPKYIPELAHLLPKRGKLESDARRFRYVKQNRLSLAWGAGNGPFSRPQEEGNSPVLWVFRYIRVSAVSDAAAPAQATLLKS